jgi:hypothetical protein
VTLPVLASIYAAFLAGIAALLSRRPALHAGTPEWSQDQVAGFRGGIARTLLVLAAVILVAAATRMQPAPLASASVGAAALVVGAVGTRTLRRRR